MSGTRLDVPQAIDSPQHGLDVAIRSTDEILEIIREGLACSYVGELRFVDAAGVEARVYIDGGRLAWIRCASHPENLGDVLRRQAGLSPGAIEQVLERCYATGEKFGEALVALGLASFDQLRQALLAHMDAHAAHMLAMGDGLRAAFVPQSHRYDRKFTLAFDDLAWVRNPELRRPAMFAEDDAATMVLGCQDSLTSIRDGLWCGVIDRTSRRCLVECHPRGIDAAAAARAVLHAGPLFAAIATRTADREFEAIVRRGPVAAAMRVFTTSEIIAAILARRCTPDRELSEALRGVAHAARVWQATNSVAARAARRRS